MNELISCIFTQELYKGLKNLLDYEEDDIEEMFMQTFRICYKDAFGELVYHDLIDNGDQITVNHINKRVCVSFSHVQLFIRFCLCYLFILGICG